MTSAELIEKIQAGEYWSECWGDCGNRLTSSCIETDDGDELPARFVTSPHLPEAVFCSSRCKRMALRAIRGAHRRRRRTINRTVAYFGPKVKILYVSGESRAGWCKCDLAKMHTDYPGCVNIKLPGMLYTASGCPWCHQFGCPEIDQTVYRAHLQSLK